MISQVFKKIKRNQMIIKWKLNNLNMNLLKSKKIMIKKDKKTNGMSQTKLKMIMDITIKMKMKLKMKVTGNKSQKNTKIKTQMEEQKTPKFSIIKQSSRSKMLLRLNHLKMKTKKSLRMKYSSCKIRIILEIINFNNKTFRKINLQAINKTKIKGNYSKHLLNKIKWMLMEINIRAHLKIWMFLKK